MSETSQTPLFFIDPEGKTVPVGFERPEDHVDAQADLGGLNVDRVHTRKRYTVTNRSDEAADTFALTSFPDWNESWFPMSKGEKSLALNGTAKILRGHHAIHEVPKAVSKMDGYAANAAHIIAPLEIYGDGGSAEGIDIRGDEAAMTTIAQVLVMTQANAADVVLRTGTKNLEARTAKKLAELRQQDQETVLELARKIVAAQTIRRVRWIAASDRLKTTDTYHATRSDADLTRRYYGQ